MIKRKPKQASPLFYATCSVIGLIVALLVLLFMTLWGRELREIGTLSQTYYILLLPLALGAASFLFGAMKSYASYRGQHLGGVLELGGPAVVAALVVVGGFLLAPTETSVVVTIRVHGPTGINEIVKEGVVRLDLGNDRRETPLGSNGEATFKEVSNRFLGKEVVILLDSYGYAISKEQEHQVLTRDPIYLEAKPKQNIEPVKLEVAICVVQRGRDILMSQRRRREGTLSWQFIAGIIKPNEDPVQRSIDETREETGITVKVVRRLGQRVLPETKVSAIYFHCEYLSGEAQNLAPNENAEVKWVDVSDVERYVTSSLFVGVKDLLDEIKSQK